MGIDGFQRIRTNDVDGNDGVIVNAVVVIKVVTLLVDLILVVVVM